MRKSNFAPSEISETLPTQKIRKVLSIVLLKYCRQNCSACSDGSDCSEGLSVDYSVDVALVATVAIVAKVSVDYSVDVALVATVAIVAKIFGLCILTV